VIRVHDAAGNVIENVPAEGRVQRTVNLLAPFGAVAERGARYEPTYHYES